MDQLACYKTFIRVVELCSFSRAAADLGIATGTASSYVSQLEAHLGVSLFKRTTRSFSVTDEGQALYERLLPLLTQLAQIEESIAPADRPPSGRLRVAVASSIAPALMAVLLPFRQRYPEIQLDVASAASTADLVREGIDCALRLGPLQDSSLFSRPLGATRLITLAAPAYLNRHGRPREPRELERHACLALLNSSGRPRDWVFARGPDQIVLDMDRHYAFRPTSSCLLAASAGLGIAQVAGIAAGRLFEQGGLEQLLPEWCTAGPPLHLVYPDGRAAPARLRAFIDHVVGTIPALLASAEVGMPEMHADEVPRPAVVRLMS